MNPLLRLLPVLALVLPASAQEAIPVGRASYAAHPPPGRMVDKKTGVDQVAEVENRRLHWVKDDGGPVPSNEWFQNLLFQTYGTGLWALPHKVDATAEGIEVFHSTRFSGDGVRALAEFPLVVTGRDFKPVDSRVKGWSDWTVTFRPFESDTRFMDVTLGEGMPAVWCEFTGVAPLLAAGGHGGKKSRAKNPPRLFDLRGGPVTLPFAGDALGITHEGQSFGVFAPDGTTFAADPAGIAVNFTGAGRFLVVCPLPKAGDIALFHRHAFAVPRDTRLAWNYDRKAGTLATTWTIDAEPLKPGAPRAVLQGFLPHHWRENTAATDLSGPVFTTIRGPMKCGAGASFALSHPFHGVLPNLPAPSAPGFEPARVGEVLAKHFADPAKKLGADTYWGGKDLQRYTQAAFVAAQLKDPSLDALTAKVRGALEDWFTYTPGEKERYFAYYPRRKGLVGFNPAYGSQHFTDQHFHYGYFTHAAGLLAQLDPSFAAGFGDFARLVAKSYANWDRADRRFPFFRTFDLWRGHSFADGNGFPDGNNQESTGEAVNSWVGLILLGEALGDEAMTAAGVMGYTFESRANLEYWFDPHGDVFPSAYSHEACGMIWCNSIVWGTWFTADPAWIYGIQWVPTAPQAAFYARTPGLVGTIYSGLEREREAFETREAAKKPGAVKKPVTIESLGGELGAYHLGFLMHEDAPRVVREIDALWAKPGDTVAHSEWMANVYYQASSLAGLGRVDWTARGDSPASGVYVRDGVRTLVAWNPGAGPRTVTFQANGRSLGTLVVPARSLAAQKATNP